MLLGRGTECESLDRLIDTIRSGESRALVLRGEAGVGKTALLDYLLAHATGCRTVRVAAGSELFGREPLFCTEVGPVLGAHLGAGVLVGGLGHPD